MYRVGKKRGDLRPCYRTKGISRVPWWFHYNVKRNLIIVPLLASESFVYEFCLLLYVSIQSQREHLLFLHEALFTVDWTYTSDKSFLLTAQWLFFSSPLSLFLSLSSARPPSLHPSTHLAEVRSGRPRRVERGMERQLEPSQTRRDKLPL